jgi:uncharacterized lipoprotein YbaY
VALPPRSIAAPQVLKEIQVALPPHPTVVLQVNEMQVVQQRSIAAPQVLKEIQVALPPHPTVVLQVKEMQVVQQPSIVVFHYLMHMHN